MIRKTGIWGITVALGSIVLTPSAFAQKITADTFISTEDREIVVTAEQDPEPVTDEVRRQARSITYASNIFDDSLPLYQKPLCPGVSGLPVDLATLIADRIRYNAQRIGLQLAEGGACSANLLVVFVLDGQKALQGIAGDGRSMLADLPAAERRALLNDPGPVHAFTAWSFRTRDGKPVSYDPDNRYYVVETQSANSLILLASRKDIEMSVVLIDIPAIDGLSAVQIADYATMRGLARTKPVEGDATYGTILNLFDENALHVSELSTFDLAYLNTLYERPPNIAAAAKLGTIGGEMKEIAAVEAAEAGVSK
jgi:hypothetical protein